MVKIYFIYQKLIYKSLPVAVIINLMKLKLLCIYIGAPTSHENLPKNEPRPEQTPGSGTQCLLHGIPGVLRTRLKSLYC